MLRSIISGLLFFVPGTLANAELAEVNWTAQLGGLDGVTLTCANANKEKFAARICNDMLQKAHGKFEAAGIRSVILGSYFVKEETRPPKPQDMKTPLAITSFVRASNSDGVHAINVRNHVSVFYKAAVESDDEKNSRKGELVLWSGSTTGSGPRDPLRAAITGASFQKLEVQLDAIVEAWPK